MFQLLSWQGKDAPDTDRQRRKFAAQFQCCQNPNPILSKSLESKPQYKTQYKTSYPDQRILDQQIALKKITENKQDRTKTVTNLIKNKLYIQDEPVHVERKSNTSQSGKKKKKKHNEPRVKVERKVKPKLDENRDKEVIERRKERIKQFNRETRFLPNTAFTTYFGKPTFQVYGRGNLKSSNGGVLSGDYLYSHNVMPHSGENHPKHQQTYKSALINASKHLKHQELPRKRDENYVSDTLSQTHSSFSPSKKTKNDFHLQLPKPDLINAERFASYPDTPLNQTKVQVKPPPPAVKKPAAKIQAKAPIKAPVSKPKEYAAGRPTQTKREASNTVKTTATAKTTSPVKNRGKEVQKPKLPEPEEEEELKFMNQRENFMNQVRDKKIKMNRLAYKVTECYPNVNGAAAENNANRPISAPPQTDIPKDPKDYKNIDSKWTERIPPAGKVSQKHVDIRNILVMQKA